MSINSAGTEAETSEAVKKVFINFLQICSLAALFPLKWPPALEAIFALMSAVSSPAQHILSPDCELSVLAAAEAFYYKQIGYGVMPVGVLFICLLMWYCGYVLNARRKGRTWAYYHDRMVLTVVCILFLLYPTMVKQSLAALACEKVGQFYYLAVDLQEVCYETRHLFFTLAVSLPQIFLYTIGLPMTATLILMRHRKMLGNRQIQFRYGILFNGYRPRLYWWELTIAVRKVILVLIAGIYGVRLGPDMQVTVALLLLLIFTASHLVFSPFSKEAQVALPEIRYDLLKAQKKSAANAEKKKQKGAGESKKNSTNETDDASECAHSVAQATKQKRGKLRQLYFTLITSTNMHMIEFGSLSVCTLTLWSGLVFFLNDREERMSRFWVEVFSVVVAIVNIVFILWIMVKYVLAVLKEAHTRTAIEVWGNHAFDHLLDNTKSNKDFWRLGVKKEKKKPAITAVVPIERSQKSVKRSRSSWNQVDQTKLIGMAKAYQVLSKHQLSKDSHHKDLEKRHVLSQQKLKNRLNGKNGGKKGENKFQTKEYNAIAFGKVEKVVSAVDAANATPVKQQQIATWSLDPAGESQKVKSGAKMRQRSEI